MKRLLLLGAVGIGLMAGGINQDALKMFAPLPEAITSQSNPLNAAKVELGRMLYYEPRLSKGQEVSCNTCHLLDRYGVDAEPVSTGHRGLKGNRNAPTVYNAAGHFVQFWDGRAPDVEAQAKGPVTNPVEMAMPSEQTAIAVLKSIPDYADKFRKAFPGQDNPVSFDNMAIAIGAFERKLVTPSRWDKFLKGDARALTPAEKAGFNRFVEVGCASCHNGVYVGGMLYQKIGVVKPWKEDADPGRFGITKQESERGVFKVPSLRNIAKTGPYFHTGKVPQLDQAVGLMAEYQNGRELSGADVEAIVTWLRTLTGEIPADYIKKPALPASTAQTPKPDQT